MAPNASDTVHMPALGARVEQAVEWMGSDERRVLWLRHGDDRSWSDIAAELGRDCAEVAELLVEARLAIDESLQELPAPPERTPECRPTRTVFCALVDGEPVEAGARAAARTHASDCPDCMAARIALRRGNMALAAWHPSAAVVTRPAAALPAPVVAQPTEEADAFTPPPPAPAHAAPVFSPPRRRGLHRRRVAIGVTAAVAAGAAAVALASTGGDGGSTAAVRADPAPESTPTPRATPRKPTLLPEKKRQQRRERRGRRQRTATPAATAAPTATATPVPTAVPQATPVPEQRSAERERRTRPEPEPTPQPQTTPPARTPTPSPTPRPTPTTTDPNGDIIPPP